MTHPALPRYPYIAYSDEVTIHPLIEGPAGDGFFVDLSPNSPDRHDIDVRDQIVFQRLLDHSMQGSSRGVSACQENREMPLGT